MYEDKVKSLTAKINNSQTLTMDQDIAFGINE